MFFGGVYLPVLFHQCLEHPPQRHRSAATITTATTDNPGLNDSNKGIADNDLYALHGAQQPLLQQRSPISHRDWLASDSQI